MGLTVGRRAHVAGLFCVCLILVSCSGHHGEGSSGHRSSFIPTNVKVPIPCKTLDAALVEEIIGPDQGITEKNIDRSQAVSSAKCSWKSSGYNDRTRKRGIIHLNITAELVQMEDAPPYSTAKAAYDNLIANKACKVIAVERSEACWYPGPLPSFWVAIQQKYITVWVLSTAIGSPAVSKKHVAETAKRIAENVVKNIAL